MSIRNLSKKLRGSLFVKKGKAMVRHMNEEYIVCNYDRKKCTCPGAKLNHKTETIKNISGGSEESMFVEPLSGQLASTRSGLQSTVSCKRKKICEDKNYLRET